MNGKKILIGAAMALAAARLYGGATGASFLSIGAGARAAGMGAAYTASADDAEAAYWNPAGLAGMGQREASATRAEWIAGESFDHLVYAQALGSGRGAWAGSLTHLSAGTLEVRGDDGSVQGKFAARDVAAGLSYARPWGEGGQWGVTVKWIEQRLADERASGYAGDFGYRRRMGGRTVLGLTVRNLGPSMQFVDEKFKLPLTASAGVEWRPLGEWSLGADWERRVPERRNVLRVGTEYRVWNRMSLRAGYSGSRDAAGASKGDAARRWAGSAGLRMGMGLRIGSTQVDYAVTSAGGFDELQQVSLSVKF